MQNRCRCGRFKSANWPYDLCKACRAARDDAVLGVDDLGFATKVGSSEPTSKVSDLQLDESPSGQQLADVSDYISEVRERRRQQLLDDPETYFAEVRERAKAQLEKEKKNPAVRPVKRSWRERLGSIRNRG